jgi:cytochrome c5
MLRAILCSALLVPLAVAAAPDAAEGRKLVQTHKCETCHSQKVYGPEGAIYLRKDRRVSTWQKLKAQVTACNTMLGVGLFPDEEEHIAAFLNDQYYKLPKN